MAYKWTFMVYMAGDNGKVFDDRNSLMCDLQKEGWRDIAGMSGIGSTADVAVTVQYDTLDENQFTPRFHLDQSSPTGRLVEKIEPVNTGDPGNLTDFIVWAMTEYPAEKYALVLWNHGSGWNEDDIYKRYRKLDDQNRRDETRAGGNAGRLLRRALFLPTVAEIMSIEEEDVRGICHDDSSMDFLDNRDLEKALRDAEVRTGRRLNVLGMDACLMSMVEVAYQIREYADYMVSSQEVELADGWPYEKILGELVGKPQMSGLDLSRLIVGQFGRHYNDRRGGSIATQSVIDLRALPHTVLKIKALAEVAHDLYPREVYTELAFTRARTDVRRFREFGKDYPDLRHLIELVKSEYGGKSNMADLAGDLAEHLSPDSAGCPIKANYAGPGRPNANGMSIYFPSIGYSPFYDQLAFTESGWNRVVQRANRVR